MDAGRKAESAPMDRTTVERASGREIVVTRTINAPARFVFEAFTQPNLLSKLRGL